MGERRRLEQDEETMRGLLAGVDGAPLDSAPPEHFVKIAQCRRWLVAKAELTEPDLM